MSTKNIEAVLKWAGQGDPPEELKAALAEVEAIRKAAATLVDWNKTGRPAFHLDAARGYDTLERIAKETSK